MCIRDSCWVSWNRRLESPRSRSQDGERSFLRYSPRFLTSLFPIGWSDGYAAMHIAIILILQDSSYHKRIVKSCTSYRGFFNIPVSFHHDCASPLWTSTTAAWPELVQHRRYMCFILVRSMVQSQGYPLAESPVFTYPNTKFTETLLIF